MAVIILAHILYFGLFQAVREKAQNKAAATVVTAANAAVKMSTFVKFYKVSLMFCMLI